MFNIEGGYVPAVRQGSGVRGRLQENVKAEVRGSKGRSLASIAR